MTFSKSLAARIRQALSAQRGLNEKRMFGGVAFLLRGNMCVGVWNDSMIVRLGAEKAGPALEQAYVRPFDVTGKPMKAWVIVEAEGLDTEVQLRSWIDQAVEFVMTLPEK